MAVGSSGNIREGRSYMQLAGAEARERLLLAAANEWGVPATVSADTGLRRFIGLMSMPH